MRDSQLLHSILFYFVHSNAFVRVYSVIVDSFSERLFYINLKYLPVLLYFYIMLRSRNLSSKTKLFLGFKMVILFILFDTGLSLIIIHTF